MAETVAQVINKLSKIHLEENDGLLFGQCLKAVGWVGGTVPQTKKGLIELCTSEVSNTGIVVGAGLVGRRPIYVIRYQGFMWLAANTLVNYAAKSKDVWSIPCPIFVRSIGMEGNGIGPTASPAQHGLIMRMPGIPVCAPMTPNEWTECWNWFLEHDDPVYCSEHRRSFAIDYEMDNIIQDNADITIIAISAARLNALEAIRRFSDEGLICNLIHLVWLKPFIVTPLIKKCVNNSQFSVVIDSDFDVCGPAKAIAYDIMHACDKKVYGFGVEDRTGGMAPELENITPSVDKIYNYIKIKYQK